MLTLFVDRRTIKPVREQPEPSAATPAGRTKKKPDRKRAEEPPPAPLKPPKKEREKKSPVGKPKKTASPPKAQPAAVIAETVGSFLVSGRVWPPLVIIDITPCLLGSSRFLVLTLIYTITHCRGHLILITCFRIHRLKFKLVSVIVQEVLISPLVAAVVNNADLRS